MTETPQSRRARPILNNQRHPVNDALDRVAKEGTIHVSRIDYTGAETNQEERVRVPVYHTHPAYVKVEGGMTINLGNYNSGRTSVSISMPCYPEVSEIERCYTFVSGLVDEYLQREEQYLHEPTGGQ